MGDDLRRAAALLAVAVAVALSALPGVAAPVAAISATSRAGDAFLATPGPSSAPEYWFDDWRVSDLWAAGARGQGVTIAEIDSGVTVLPQLAGRVVKGVDLGSDGGDGRTDREADPFGHGTAMASIMVARPGPFGITGLAPGAKILPIAIPLTGTTEAGEPDRLADAIRYAADHGAKIVNMSLGGKRSSSGDDLACNTDEQSAVYYALARGLVLTAAVGNSGPTRNTVEDPAVCLGVLAVGAAKADGAVASFSTRQPYVSLLAPGVDVPSLGRVAGDAYSGDGTSQATAITSAALALVWSKYPTLRGTQVVARVLATLDHRRASSTAATGYGVLDAGRAVRTDVPASAPDPIAAAVAPFLARYVAGGHSTPAPAASTAPPGGFGDYAVGGTIGRTDRRVGYGAAGALFGLVLVLGAALSAARARRRRVVGGTGISDEQHGDGHDGASVDENFRPTP